MQPQFYSKKTIGLLALLLSPFLTSIVFAYNLKEIGKGKIGPLFIIITLFFTGLISQFMHNFNVLYRMAIVNILGSILLTFLWDKYFADLSYEKKSFWKPTLFFIGICIVLIWVQFVFASRYP
jgi:hypothetical protein